MNPQVQAQVAAAQLDAERVFHEDQAQFEISTGKTVARGGFGLELKDSGNVVTASPVDKRVVEGPKIGETTKKPGSLHAPASIESWGKPNRR